MNLTFYFPCRSNEGTVSNIYRWSIYTGNRSIKPA